MSYVPNFAYDIFISFSHQDNEPRPGQDTGWVERFVDYLKWFGKRRGLAGLEIWWDKRRLTGATEFDSRIERDLGRTALLVVLHSHNYRRSAYCEQELDWFVTAARSHPLGLTVNGERRIFNVLINKIPHQAWIDSGHWTEPLAGTIGFPFHDAPDDKNAFGYPIEDSDHKSYDAAMRLIVDAAKTVLEAMRAQQATAAPVPAIPGGPAEDLPPCVFPASVSDAPDNQCESLIQEAPVMTLQVPKDMLPCIFLATVDDDQDDLRERLASEIGGRARILGEIPPPLAHREHTQAIVTALGQADLSIHLLGASPGRKIEDRRETSYPREQVEIALTRPVPQILWLPVDLSPNDIQDPAHRDWLQALETGEREEAKFELVRCGTSDLIALILGRIEDLR